MFDIADLDSIEHFEATQHAFAMDVDNGRIWSYESDRYVHRMISERHEVGSQQAARNSHVHAGAAEFDQLLAIQLESQRIFFEGQLAKADSRVSRFLDREDEFRKDLEKAQEELHKSNSLLSHAHQATHDQMAATRRAEAKTKTLSSLARSLELQYKDEKSINHALLERIAFMEAEATRMLEDKRKTSNELDELREQLNDVLLHLSGAQKMATIPEMLEATVNKRRVRLTSADHVG